MSDTVRMQAFVEADFEDIEECIAKDYRHYVKLKSRDEPYEVTKDTYEWVLALIAEANAKLEELKPCPWCGGRPTSGSFGEWNGLYQIVHMCENGGVIVRTKTCSSKSSAIAEWNRRAE